MNLGKLLEESGAILRGHFVLTSGRHSDVYFEKFRVLEQPRVLSALCSEIAEHFREKSIDIVAGPLTGGIIIAFEVARQLGCNAVYVESECGVKMLRRGATVREGSRVLVVDDVLTTGKSIQEVLSVMRNCRALPVGVGVLISRSESVPDFGCPCYAAHHVEAKTWAPEDVPEWLAAIPPVKPGTRPNVCGC